MADRPQHVRDRRVDGVQQPHHHRIARRPRDGKMQRQVGLYEAFRVAARLTHLGQHPAQLGVVFRAGPHRRLRDGVVFQRLPGIEKIERLPLTGDCAQPQIDTGRPLGGLQNQSAAPRTGIDHPRRRQDADGLAHGRHAGAVLHGQFALGRQGIAGAEFPLVQQALDVVGDVLAQRQLFLRVEGEGRGGHGSRLSERKAADGDVGGWGRRRLMARVKLVRRRSMAWASSLSSVTV